MPSAAEVSAAPAFIPSGLRCRSKSLNEEKKDEEVSPLPASQRATGVGLTVAAGRKEGRSPAVRAELRQQREKLLLLGRVQRREPAAVTAARREPDFSVHERETFATGGEAGAASVDAAATDATPPSSVDANDWFRTDCEPPVYPPAVMCTDRKSRENILKGNRAAPDVKTVQTMEELKEGDFTQPRKMN